MFVFSFEEIDSTSTFARRLLESDTGDGSRIAQNLIDSNFIVIAKSQTAGRGRRGNSFISPEGGIYFSYVINAPADDLNSTANHDTDAGINYPGLFGFDPDLLTAKVGLAVCESVEALIASKTLIPKEFQNAYKSQSTDTSQIADKFQNEDKPLIEDNPRQSTNSSSAENLVPKIKWVNDIYIGDKKVCGILCEKVTVKEKTLTTTDKKETVQNSAETTKEKIIIGIGINLSSENLSADIKEFAAGLLDFYDFNINCNNAALTDEADCFQEAFGEPNELSTLKKALVLEILKGIDRSYPAAELVSDYEKRSYLTGKDISFIQNGIRYFGRVIGINEKCNLIVELINNPLCAAENSSAPSANAAAAAAGGTTIILSSGEVHTVRSKTFF